MTERDFNIFNFPLLKKGAILYKNIIRNYNYFLIWILVFIAILSLYGIYTLMNFYLPNY